METQEIKGGIIGSEITLMVYGMRVKGTITGIFKEKTYMGGEILGLKVSHEPVQWGDNVYTEKVSLGKNLSTIKFI